MKKSLCNLPNSICLGRIALLPVLYYLFFTNNHVPFVILVVLGGVSDAVDGVLARRLKQESEFGATLDSVADWLYYGSFGFWFGTRNYWAIMLYLKFLLIPLLFIVIAYIVMAFRFCHIMFLHLYSSKFVAVVAYLLILVMLLNGFNAVLVRILILLWSLTALEILLVSCVMKKAQSNITSIMRLP